MDSWDHFMLSDSLVVRQTTEMACRCQAIMNALAASNAGISDRAVAIGTNCHVIEVGSLKQLVIMSNGFLVSTVAGVINLRLGMT